MVSDRRASGISTEVDLDVAVVTGVMDQLPRPLHPGVGCRSLLRNRLSTAIADQRSLGWGRCCSEPVADKSGVCGIAVRRRLAHESLL